MKSFIALIVMIAWSAAIVMFMNAVGITDRHADWLWSLAGAVTLLVGLVGNVWIFLLIAKEEPWAWLKGGKDESEI